MTKRLRCCGEGFDLELGHGERDECYDIDTFDGKLLAVVATCRKCGNTFNIGSTIHQHEFSVLHISWTKDGNYVSHDNVDEHLPC